LRVRQESAISCSICCSICCSIWKPFRRQLHKVSQLLCILK
jgi:hypothetical protein